MAALVRRVARAGLVILLPGVVAAVALAAPRPSPGPGFAAAGEAGALPVPPGTAAPTLPRGLTVPAAEPPQRQPATVPSRAAVENGTEYARSRAGLVSFAVIDSASHLRGFRENRRHPSASVIKAMVLAAELWRLARGDAPVDSATRSLLRAMITYSDNAAADTIYARVGDPGLREVAGRAGMERFEVAGHWGNAQVTASDLARLFHDLDAILPVPHREYGLRLLASIVPEQSWGIPAAAGDRWAVRFKGGWLPEKALVHQAAELRERGGPRQVSIAILTDGQPSHGYGVETVRGVANRLLATPAR